MNIVVKESGMASIVGGSFLGAGVLGFVVYLIYKKWKEHKEE